MHGRKKKSLDSGISEEERKQAVDARSLLAHILLLKRENSRSVEALKLTSDILNINPELSTVWNYRRQILSKEALKDELLFLEKVLAESLKSYCVWFHRRWCFDSLADNGVELTALIQSELELCERLFTFDARNFHCWGYRYHVTRRLSSHERQRVDLALSTKLIMSDFSNYSAWHLRTTIDIDDIEKEVSLLRDAIFTEPSDQSVWQYREWFLKKHGISDDSTIDELLSIEPECKYALIAKGSSNGILARIDSLRIGYYEDHVGVE